MYDCHTLVVNCFAVNHAHFVTRKPQKKGIRPIVKQIKYVKGVSCVGQFCRGQTEPVMENLGCPWGQFQRHRNLQERLYPPLPEPTNFD